MSFIGRFHYQTPPRPRASWPGSGTEHNPGPSGQKIYAANAALGVVAEVNLQEVAVTKQRQFPAHPLPARYRGEAGLNASLLTADGKTLYFTDGRQLWAYDTAAGSVSEPPLETDNNSVQGLALSADGQSLYIAWA